MLTHATRWWCLAATLAIAVQWSAVGNSAADDAAPQQLLQGIVVDESGTPIVGAKITAVSGTTTEERTSDQSGAFEFRLTINSAGAIYAALAAETPDGRLASLSVTQQKPEPVRLVVKPARDLAILVQNAAGQPIAGAEVVFIVNYRRLAGGSTSAAGRWSGRVPAEATGWSVYARKSGEGFDYATASRPRGATADPHPLPDQLTLKLDGAKSLKVKAVDRDNRPVAGVIVGPWIIKKPEYEAEINLSGVTEGWPKTGDDGTALLDWLPLRVERGWNIVYRVENYFALDHSFAIPADKPTDELVINLLPLEELGGRVTHVDGRPAAGVLVRVQGKGAGMNDCTAAARTDAEGRYKVRAYSEQAYVVAVDDKEWAAPYRADVVVRAGQPVSSVDFVLSKPTRIHGRVTMGNTEQPAPKARLSAVIDKGQIPAELRSKTDRFYRSISMFFYATADDNGNYEFFLGPGDYRLQGPPRTQTVQIKIPADGTQTDIVRDFQMPRPEAGTFMVRVVNSQGKPMPAAMLSGSYASNQARRLFTPVKTDAQGTFKTERSLDPLVLHAITVDKQLAGVVRVDADAKEAEIVVGPLATASGRLLDLKGEPLADKNLKFGIRVYQGEPGRSPWMESFGGQTTTDADGRFSFLQLVPGQRYEASIKIDDLHSRRVVDVKPSSPESIDLGDIKADTEPIKPYVPPTPAERTSTAFSARPKDSARERLERILGTVEREYMRPMLLLGNPADKACVELFGLFEERAEASDKSASDQSSSEKPATPAALRWEFELLPLDDARPDTHEFTKQLGIQRQNNEPLLAVLSADGTLTATLPLVLSGDKLDGKAIGQFMAAHKLPTRDAQKMLDEGLAKAKAEDKRLFFIFSASWCGPCRLLAEFLSQHKAEFDRHYVFVKLDVSRDDHAQELREKYKESRSGGVPWYTILDADGNMLITSNAAADEDEPSRNTNIGHPSEAKGIDHFIKMLKETAPRLSAEKLAQLKAALTKADEK